MRRSGHFVHRGLDVLAVDGLGLLDDRSEERVMGERLDFARQAAGCLEDCLHRAGPEERKLAAGDA
jgi:hypothetical protein